MTLLLERTDLSVDNLAEAIMELVRDAHPIPDGSVATIDEDGLVPVLMGLNRAVSFAGLICKTEPAIVKPKTSGMAGRIHKLSHISVAIGEAMTYGKIVNGRRDRLADAEGIDRPGDYVVQPRKWGVRVPNTPFVVNKGVMYLECVVNKVLRTEYRLDGAAVEKSDIDQYLVTRAADTTEERTGVSVIWRDYKLSSIEQVRVDGRVFDVAR